MAVLLILILLAIGCLAVTCAQGELPAGSPPRTAAAGSGGTAS